ncbi:unnamed protein product [Clonostachys rosea]|uniref:Uncharacterized protein n=1 Tax=Bionectria ochroleuca TaxID=29856 RepID=A0ABY6UJ82_BIOOC|nr:unnamed protein product [Clonostachys rosea]
MRPIGARNFHLRMLDQVETLYSNKTNPMFDLLAAEGIKRLFTALTQIAQHTHDKPARHSAQYGAALKDMGTKESGIDADADLAMESAYWNPRPL